jgi:hypothetical protein
MVGIRLCCAVSVRSLMYAYGGQAGHSSRQVILFYICIELRIQVQQVFDWCGSLT